MAVTTINFGKDGGTQTANYSFTCGNVDSFSSEIAGGTPCSWMSVQNVAEDSKVIVTVQKNTTTGTRTAYIIPIINSVKCDDKKLTVTQIGAATQSCECSNVLVNKTYMTWPVNDNTTEQQFSIKKPSYCELTNVEFSQVANFIVTTAESTNSVIVTVKPTNGTHVVSTEVLRITYKIGNTVCNTSETEKRVNLQFTNDETPASYFLNESLLFEEGKQNQEIGTYTLSQGSTYSNLTVSSSSNWMTVSLAEPVGSTGKILASYGPATARRSASVSLAYASAPIGEPSTVTQEAYGEFKIWYEITVHELNKCGSDEHVIGKYHYDNCETIATSSLSILGQRPDWVSSMIFGAANPSTKSGDIIIRYNKNDTNATRSWPGGISLLYNSNYTIPIKTGTNSDVSQPAADSSCDPTTPTSLPSTCSEANFYHYDNPYAANMDHFYQLEHKISAYKQDYQLRTWTDGQFSNGKYLITDPMWEDVRIEIYDVTPIIAHRSACGSHYIDTSVGGTFAHMKAEHEKMINNVPQHCPCWSGAVHSGEYVVEGYTNPELVATYEGKDGFTGSTKYDTFWLKLDENVWMSSQSTGYNLCTSFGQYNSTCDCRAIAFKVDSNISSVDYPAVDRCAIIKVYPKIGGTYCTGDCGCESEARCSHKCTCVTDLVTQEAVDCSQPNEYFDPNHAYFNRYTTVGYNEPLNNQMIYNYWWGPCDDTGPYINAVDVYEAFVTVTYDGNIKHTNKIGKYL